MRPSRSPALRSAVSAAALVVAAAGLTACESGQNAETRQIKVNAALGAVGSIGNLVVRDVYVTPATGASGAGSSSPSAQAATSGYVVATIANSGTSGSDTLTGVTVDGTQATPQTGGAAASASPTRTRTASPAASPGTKAGASPSAQALPTATPAATAGAGALTVGPHEVISFRDAGGTGVRLFVTGLSTPLRDGTFAQVTFTFASAGSVTVQAPVAVNPGTTQTATPMPVVSLETTTPRQHPPESTAP